MKGIPKIMYGLADARPFADLRADSMLRCPHFWCGRPRCGTVFVRLQATQVWVTTDSLFAQEGRHFRGSNVDQEQFLLRQEPGDPVCDLCALQRRVSENGYSHSSGRSEIRQPGERMEWNGRASHGLHFRRGVYQRILP